MKCFKPLKNFIVIKVEPKEEIEGFVLPEHESYDPFVKCEVVSIGKDIRDYKPKDIILVRGHLIEDFEGMVFTTDHGVVGYYVEDQNEKYV